MDDDATTPSSITTSMHDTSTAGTPTPTDLDLDECMRDVLSHIFGEAHADWESDKLIASVTKHTASQPVSGRNQRLRIFLQRIYVKCYPNVNDRTSHQS
jgi:hypothetical protein